MLAKETLEACEPKKYIQTDMFLRYGLNMLNNIKNCMQMNGVTLIT